MDKIEQLYFYWLIGFVCHNDEIRKYRLVLEQLYFKDFRWTLEMDENLAGHGLALRSKYIDESPTGRRYARLYDDYERECNVLEMMVALSMNMEGIMQNDIYGNRCTEWFWDMMHSLGLDIYDDKHFDEQKVDKILEKFLDRKYSSTGRGGLFTLGSGTNLMEIWSQATNYISKIAEKNGEIW